MKKLLIVLLIAATQVNALNYSAGTAADLPPGQTALLFNAEQPTAPQASVAVHLVNPSNAIENGFSLELFFSGAPGVFEVDIQEADTDTDAAYIKYQAITTVSSNNYARVDVPRGGIRANYARAYIVSRANAVNLTAKISR